MVFFESQSVNRPVPCHTTLNWRANGRPEAWRAIRRVGVGWRREWDSNPRLSFPNTRFPSVLLKPLGHLSAEASFTSLTN
jgi:hypothetical protein